MNRKKPTGIWCEQCEVVCCPSGLETWPHFILFSGKEQIWWWDLVKHKSTCLWPAFSPTNLHLKHIAIIMQDYSWIVVIFVLHMLFWEHNLHPIIFIAFSTTDTDQISTKHTSLHIMSSAGEQHWNTQLKERQIEMMHKHLELNDLCQNTFEFILRLCVCVCACACVCKCFWEQTKTEPFTMWQILSVTAHRTISIVTL